MSKVDFGDDGTRAIVRQIAEEAAEIALQRHSESCPVHDIKATVYGNGSEGLKVKTARMEEKLTALEERVEAPRSWMSSMLTNLVPMVIVGVFVWLMTIWAKHR